MATQERVLRPHSIPFLRISTMPPIIRSANPLPCSHTHRNRRLDFHKDAIHYGKRQGKVVVTASYLTLAACLTALP